MGHNLLQAWLKKVSTGARGLSLKLVDGTHVVLYPPFMVGDDFVAGSLSERDNAEVAYTFSGLICVQPLAPKPPGF